MHTTAFDKSLKLRRIESPLDNATFHALQGRQKQFGFATESAVAYATDVAPFAALREESRENWAALHSLVTPDDRRAFFTLEPLSPTRDLFEVTHRDIALQMVSPDGVGTTPTGALTELGPIDIPEMSALVAITRPGPFATRTPEMGQYVGVRVNGALVAMAGERIALDGFTEISAVCVHPDYRGRGYAARVVMHMQHLILDRGEQPFLHVFENNLSAIALYRKLGFVERARLHLLVASALPGA